MPLFGQGLYHFIVPNKSPPPHAGGAALSPLVLSRPYTLLGRPGQCGYFCITPAGRRLVPTYDLMCSRPPTRRIFSGIRFRALKHSAPLGHRVPPFLGI
ncbi:hypothetical protein AVEN_39750-1 [Araneus ventricosus]|uniref:Uncharacterized protein n=1 Tax=Araneus ventricosus TaxID=182803 RepID=A0A4Y2LM69_ARAVE|nr:hypothetical protein AVEN_39750-1 [Araneus ventricosus]